jgi:N-acetylneuraminic acid mutarotase
MTARHSKHSNTARSAPSRASSAAYRRVFSIGAAVARGALLSHWGRTLVVGFALMVATSTAAGEPSAPTHSAGWVQLGPSLLERSEPATAALGNEIYVVGGFIGPTTTNQVERYDARRDRWELLKPMPVALNHPSAVTYGGDLYVLGGYTNGISTPGVPTGGLLDTSDAFLRYDPHTNSWSEMPSMPARRSAAAAAVIGDRLYVAGGRAHFPTYTTSEGLLARLDIFDFSIRTWSRGPDMSIAREHVAGAAAAGAFYVIGGRTVLDSVAAVERYAPSQGRWERVANMRVPHNGFPAVTVGDRIVVFGSEEPSNAQLRTYNEATELFDPATGRWGALPDMRTPRGALGGAAIGQRVYAIEGIAAQPATSVGFGSNVVEALDVPSAAQHHHAPVSARHNPLGLPSASSCLKSGRLVVRLRQPRRARFVRVAVFVNGRRVLTRRRHRIRRIVLRGLPQGRFRLKMAATTNRGRRINSARTYVGCLSRHALREA